MRTVVDGPLSIRFFKQFSRVRIRVWGIGIRIFGNTSLSASPGSRLVFVFANIFKMESCMVVNAAVSVKGFSETDHGCTEYAIGHKSEDSPINHWIFF